MQSMVMDLEKRMPFRRVMKQTINRAERSGLELRLWWVVV